MKSNPFISEERKPIAEKARDWQSHPASDDLANSENEWVAGDLEPQPHARRFVKLAGLSSVVFLILLFFVFREIQHSRDLYRMSRLVVAAEAQKRQWQERQRLAEAREAGLVAELQRQLSPIRNPQIIKAAYTIPSRRR